jgi:hypothetical protein
MPDYNDSAYLRGLMVEDSKYIKKLENERKEITEKFNGVNKLHYLQLMF